MVLRARGGKTLGGQGSRINDRFFVGGPVVMRGFRTKGLGPRAQVCGWVGEWVGGCVCIHIIYYTDIYIYTHTTDKTHARTHKHTHKHKHTHTHTHTGRELSGKCQRRRRLFYGRDYRDAGSAQVQNGKKWEKNQKNLKSTLDPDLYFKVSTLRSIF